MNKTETEQQRYLRFQAKLAEVNRVCAGCVNPDNVHNQYCEATVITGCVPLTPLKSKGKESTRGQ